MYTILPGKIWWSVHIYWVMSCKKTWFSAFLKESVLAVFSLGCDTLSLDWFCHSAVTCRKPLAQNGNSLSYLIRYLIHNKSIVISFMFAGNEGGAAGKGTLCFFAPPYPPSLFVSSLHHLHTWYQLISWLLSGDYWCRRSGCICCSLFCRGHDAFVCSSLFVRRVLCVCVCACMFVLFCFC